MNGRKHWNESGKRKMPAHSRRGAQAGAQRKSETQLPPKTSRELQYEFMRNLIDFLQAWSFCEAMACRRARRCLAVPPPCYVRHEAELIDLIRTEIVPHLREQMRECGVNPGIDSPEVAAEKLRQGPR